MHRSARVFLFILAVLLAAAPCCQAVLKEETLLAQPVTRGDYRLESFEYLQNTLYFVDQGTLYALAPGQDAPQAFDIGPLANLPPAPSWQTRWKLLRDGGALHLLNWNQGLLYPLDVSGPQPILKAPIQLDWADYIRDAGGTPYTSAPEGYAIAQGCLFAVEQENGRRLVSFALADGGKTMYQTANVEAFTPYQGGRLLVATRDQAQAQGYQWGVFDPQQDRLEAKGALLSGDGQGDNLFGFAYDGQADILYAMVDQQILRFPVLGQGEVCAQLPPLFYMPDAMRLADGGYCAVATPNGLLIRSLDPQAMRSKTTLTVWGAVERPALTAAALSMPEVNIQAVGLSGEDSVENRLVSGDDQVDIFRLSLPMYDFAAMLKKGYFEDLSASPQVAAWHQSLYPFVKKALEADGKIAAVAVHAELWDMCMYDTAFFAQTGQPLPRTFAQLCALVQAWPSYQQDFADMIPLEISQGAREALIGMALSVYLNHLRQAPPAQAFDSALLRDLLSAAEQTAASLGKAPPQNEGSYFSPLFSPGEQVRVVDFHGQGRDAHTVKPLALAADAAAQPAPALYLEVLVVNPRSRQKAAAVRFLEAAVANLPLEERITLCPDQNTALENPNYAEGLKNYQAMVDNARLRLQGAQPEQKQQMESLLASEEKRLQAFERDERYLLTAEDIAAYRQVMQHGFVRLGGWDAQFENALWELRSRYAAGQIHMDQFIREAQNKLELIRQEAQ